MTATVPTADEFDALQQRVADLDARVLALEETATTPPPVINPPDPPDPADLKGLTATLTIDGADYVFSQDGGTDLGDYTDPAGHFVQHCVLASNEELPSLTVMFRPDADGKRDEVVFEYGDCWSGTAAANLPVYTAVIARNGETLATVECPSGHYWYSRWRWQSAPRPVIHEVAELISAGLLPHYDDAICGGHTPPCGQKTYAGPMSLAGLEAYMPSSGERDEIGLITEQQAEYVCTCSDATLASMRAQLEAAGSMPWHWRDAGDDHAPLDVWTKHPQALLNDGSGQPPVRTVDTGIALDTAHMPELAYVPFVLTGDPYALEELQFTTVFNLLSYLPSKGWSLGFAVRACAWALRSLARNATVSPEVVPSWLRPRSYWQVLLDSQRGWFMESFVASTAPPNCPPICLVGNADGAPETGAVPRDCGIGIWMEDFMLAVIGAVVDLGHADWQPILAWKAQCTIARTSGTSGWVKAYPVPHWLALRASATAPYCRDWTEEWTLNEEMQSIAIDDPEHLADGSDLNYPSYAQAGLALAARHGIAEAEPCREWLREEFATHVSPQTKIDRKWAIV